MVEYLQFSSHAQLNWLINGKKLELYRDFRNQVPRNITKGTEISVKSKVYLDRWITLEQRFSSHIEPAVVQPNTFYKPRRLNFKTILIFSQLMNGILLFSEAVPNYINRFVLIKLSLIVEKTNNINAFMINYFMRSFYFSRPTQIQKRLKFLNY